MAPPPVTLAYHAIRHVPRDEDPYNLAVHPDRLRGHVRSLRRWGYRIVGFGELATAVGAGRADGLAALTFDDGIGDNLDELVPVLADLGATATVFVAVGLLGGTHPDTGWPMLDEDGVTALAEAGVEIGNHGWAHVDLRTAPDLELEVVRSRRRLQELSGQPVDVFAYPFGAADDRVATAVGDAGHRAAVLTSGHGAWDRPLHLPRQDATRGMSTPGLWLRTRDRYEGVVSTTPGRVVRRLAHVVTGRRG